MQLQVDSQQFLFYFLFGREVYLERKAEPFVYAELSFGFAKVDSFFLFQ